MEVKRGDIHIYGVFSMALARKMHFLTTGVVGISGRRFVMKKKNFYLQVIKSGVVVRVAHHELITMCLRFLILLFLYLILFLKPIQLLLNMKPKERESSNFIRERIL